MASHEEENEEMQGFHFDDVESDIESEEDEDGEPVIDPQKDIFFTQEFDVEDIEKDNEE